MAESDHVSSQAARNLVNGAAAEPATEIAAMIRLVCEQLQRRIIGMVRPLHAEALDIFADSLHRREELTLLHRKSADTEIDGRALLQQQQHFEHGHRILAARNSNGNAVAIANHVKAMDRF